MFCPSYSQLYTYIQHSSALLKYLGSFYQGYVPGDCVESNQSSESDFLVRDSEGILVVLCQRNSYLEDLLLEQLTEKKWEVIKKAISVAHLD